jgi:hypothetical protein
VTPYIPIRDLLFSSDGNHEVILVLRAYLDESGKLKNPGETASAIGGCIASANQWTAFEGQWLNVLRMPQFNIKQLHMNNLESSTGEFVGWDDEKKDVFLDLLLDVMKNHTIKYLGAVVPLTSFNELDSVSKIKLCDPYFICLEDSILFAAEVAKDLFDPPEYVEIICDRNAQFQAKALKSYAACESHPAVGDRLAMIGFGRMDRILPLQAADLVAYELLQAGRMILDHGQNIIDNSRRCLARLIADKNPEFHFNYSTDDLRNRIPSYKKTGTERINI